MLRNLNFELRNVREMCLIEFAMSNESNAFTFLTSTSTIPRDRHPFLAQVMNTMQGFFEWESFELVLNCLSRWFSLRARCDRFMAVCINKNPRIQDAWTLICVALLFSVVLQKPTSDIESDIFLLFVYLFV